MTRDGHINRFVANTPADVIDRVRDEAARCCDETARWERGERGPIRTPADANPLLAEFSDDALGVSAEVAMVVGDALRQTGLPYHVAFAWSTAAALLRNGWQRGDVLKPHVLKGKPS